MKKLFWSVILVGILILGGGILSDFSPEVVYAQNGDPAVENEDSTEEDKDSTEGDKDSAEYEDFKGIIPSTTETGARTHELAKKIPSALILKKSYFLYRTKF